MKKTNRTPGPKDARSEPFRMLLIRKWPSDLVKKAPSVIKAYRKYAHLLQATRKNATATGPAAKRRELALGRSAHRVVEELFAFRCSLTKQTRQITNAQDSIEEGYITNMLADEINSVLTSNFALEFLRSPGVKEAIGSLYWILLEPPPRLVIVPLSVRIEEEDDDIDESEKEEEKNKSPKSPQTPRSPRIPTTPISPWIFRTPLTPKSSTVRQVMLPPKLPAATKEKSVKWVDQLAALKPNAPNSTMTIRAQSESRPTPAEVVRKEMGWWQVPRNAKDTKPQNVPNASVHQLLVRRVVEQGRLDAIVRERKKIKYEDDFKTCMERNPFASIRKPASWQKKHMQIPKSPQGTKGAPAKCHYCRKQDALDPKWVFWLRPAGIPPLCQFCERRRLRGEFFEEPQKQPLSTTEMRDRPARAQMEMVQPEEVQNPWGMQNLWDRWGPWGAWSPWRLQAAEKPSMRVEPKNSRWMGLNAQSKRPEAALSLQYPTPKRQRPVMDIKTPSKMPDQSWSMELDSSQKPKSPGVERPQLEAEAEVEAQLEAQLEAELEAEIEAELETHSMEANPLDIPLPKTPPETPESPNPLIISLPETSATIQESSPESPWDPEILELSSEPKNTEPGILKLKIPLTNHPPSILPESILPKYPSDIPLPQTPDIIELEIPLCQSPENMETPEPTAKCAGLPKLPKMRKLTESRIFKPKTPPHHRISKKKLSEPRIVQTSLANMLRMTMASFITSTRTSAAGRKNNRRSIYSMRSIHNSAKIRRLRGQGRILNDPLRFYDQYW